MIIFINTFYISLSTSSIYFFCCFFVFRGLHGYFLFFDDVREVVDVNVDGPGWLLIEEGPGRLLVEVDDVWLLDGVIIFGLLMLLGVLLLDDLLRRLLDKRDASHNRSCMPDSIITGTSGTSAMCSGIMMWLASVITVSASCS